MQEERVLASGTVYILSNRMCYDTEVRLYCENMAVTVKAIDLSYRTFFMKTPPRARRGGVLQLQPGA
jgi:hypothetical protein